MTARDCAPLRYGLARVAGPAGAGTLLSDKSFAGELTASSRRALPRIFVGLVDDADAPAGVGRPTGAGAGLVPSDRSRPVELRSRRLAPLARFMRAGAAVRPALADGPLASDRSRSVEFAESGCDEPPRRFIRPLAGADAAAPALAFAAPSD